MAKCWLAKATSAVTSPDGGVSTGPSPTASGRASHRAGRGEGDGDGPPPPAACSARNFVRASPRSRRPDHVVDDATTIRSKAGNFALFERR
jgi:hypothetical protein